MSVGFPASVAAVFAASAANSPVLAGVPATADLGSVSRPAARASLFPVAGPATKLGAKRRALMAQVS